MNPLPAPPPTRLPRGLPALAALLTVTLLLAALDAYIGHRLKHGTLQLAALNRPENTRGTALQRELFARPHALPVYGSSELDIDEPTRADLFFAGHGHEDFQVFVVGHPGDRCLPMLQEIAAQGEAVRGKKVVLFLSPSWFLPPPAFRAEEHTEHREMAATFSPLQAGLWLSGRRLKPATKRGIAVRLLDYGNVIRTRSPLVGEALTGLAARSWTGRCRGYAVRPLLALQTTVLAWQDRYHQLELLRARPALRSEDRPFVPRHKFAGWSLLLDEVIRAQSKGNRTGRSNEASLSNPDSREPRGSGALNAVRDQDADFLRRMDACPEWRDLDLLLRTLRELGARPLLVGQPINGLLSDRQGISPQARREYYGRLERLAGSHRVPLRDFSASEEDPAFFLDAVHPSAKAWVRYDQVLAEFYQGRDASPRRP